CSRGGGSGW
nr:immunoglobulin heavy chain junction region [Homo sapiens]